MKDNKRKLSSYERSIMKLKIMKTANKNPKFKERVRTIADDNKKTLTNKEWVKTMPKAEKAKRMFLIKKNRKLMAEKEASKTENDDFYRNNIGIVLSRKVSNGIVNIIRAAYITGETAEVAIKRAIEYIKFTDEYKLLSKQQQLEVNADLVIDVVTHNLRNNEKHNKQSL